MLATYLQQENKATYYEVSDARVQLVYLSRSCRDIQCACTQRGALQRAKADGVGVGVGGGGWGVNSFEPNSPIWTLYCVAFTCRRKRAQEMFLKNENATECQLISHGTSLHYALPLCARLYFALCTHQIIPMKDSGVYFSMHTGIIPYIFVYDM